MPRVFYKFATHLLQEPADEITPIFKDLFGLKWQYAPEIHIRRQFALDEILVLHCHLVKAHGSLEQLIFTGSNSRQR